MRCISKQTGGYKVYAVSGVNTISFAIDFAHADTKGLLGFAVERLDLQNNERYFVKGFKVFKEVVQNPNENTVVSTYDQPVQSFVWDDFTAKPDNKYSYFFYPIKGSPKKLDRSAPPIEITVQAEPLYSQTDAHDIFFNRGVASSQAYIRRFHNIAPDQVADFQKKKEILSWLARDLEDALIAFINQAQKGDTLLACFYEFRYKPVAVAFKQAIDRGVTVNILIDAKENKENFPRDDNLKLIKEVGIPQKYISKRTANSGKIQHNKFIVFLKGKSKKPTAVWTGSTNISMGGIFGQTNVGHWVRDTKTAKQFTKYWELLSTDPGALSSDTREEKIKKNKAFKKKVIALQQDISPDDLSNIPVGVTPIFSPRTNVTMLHTYAHLLDSADHYAAITLAFGINDAFKTLLTDNTAKDQITFMLLEKKDKPVPGSKKKFTYLGVRNNVYQAWGSYIKDPLYQWTKEVNTQLLKLNNHVMYIHSKFLLVDPLGETPVIVTGSANFSNASTTDNDENMLIIKGNKRVADIYFTEFNRLFNHYYFRSIYESHKKKDYAKDSSLFLSPNDSWLSKYEKGKLRYKRVMMFRKIKLS
ncbi:MAG: phospholipase D-like domain-containing protein [Patescibacteria group bacterium]